MLISRIPADVHAVEFAANNATALIPRSGEGGFAEYLARSMETGAGSSRPADEPDQTRSNQIISYDPSHAPHSPVETHSSPDYASKEKGPGTEAPPEKAPENASEKAPEKSADAKRPSDDTGSAQNRDGEDAAERSTSAGKSVKAAKSSASVKEAEGNAEPQGKSPGAEAVLLTPIPDKPSGSEVVLKSSESRQSEAPATDKRKGVPAGAIATVSVTKESANSVTLDVKIPQPAAGQSAPQGESVETEVDQQSGRKKSHEAESRTRVVTKEGGSRLSMLTQGEAGRIQADELPRESRTKSAREARIELNDLREAKRAAPEASAQRGSQHSSSGNRDNTGAEGWRLQSGSQPGGSAGGSTGGSTEGSTAQISLTQRAEGFAGRMNGAQQTTHSLQSGLSRALQDGLNSEIVRSARLVVRNNDSGSIRLNLRPEQLGSVRISLQMQDGHIAGRIIVDNQTVREAFEQNMHALERAFQEAGLEMGQVDVTLSDSQTQSEQASKQGGRMKRDREVQALAGSVPPIDWISEDHELVDVTV